MTSGQPTQPVSQEEPAPTGNRGRRLLRLFRVGIQSKLLVTLLLCSIMSVAVVGLTGYVTGRNALQQVATERLLELRESHKRQLEGLFGEFTNSLEVYSSGFSAVQAIEAFTDGFNQLSNATISPAQQESIVNYYSNAVVKPISQLTGDDVDINALLPTSNSQKYLQANYTPQCASATESVSCSDAGDGSTWSAANARYNDFFRGIVTRFDYRDALLLDLHGNVVYTVSKGPDLGTNIFTGPYRETVLRDAYRKALRSNNVNFVWITDFQQYQPQLDAPTAWVVSPIGMAGKIEGVMALPLPISKINDIMNAHKHWEAVGMGRSTETYLVGPDNLMRSDSRLFLQDRDKYQREAIAGGTPRDVVDSAIRLGTTVLVQPVPSAGVRYAERGQTGVTKDTDYLGNRELQAYAPVDVPNSDLHWSILATRDDWDAYQRLSTFGKTLVLAVAGITLAICVVSMLLAKLLVRPIRRLEAGTERISAGDYEVTVPVRSRDELGDLTAAFNEMSRNLKIKEELLNEQRKENDRLLLSLMPHRSCSGIARECRPSRRNTRTSPSSSPTWWGSTTCPTTCPETNWSPSSTNFSGSSTRRPKRLAWKGFERSTTATWPAAVPPPRGWTTSTEALTSPSRSSASSTDSTAGPDTSSGCGSASIPGRSSAAWSVAPASPTTCGVPR